MNQGIDSRTNNPGYMSDNSISASDGQVDYTIIIWRYDGNRFHNPDGTLGLENASGSGGGFAGVAGVTLTPTGTNPTLRTTDGFTQCVGYSGMDKAIFTHEFAHTLYNAPHVFGANGVVGKHLYASTGYGMIGGPMLDCANGWERWYMNWITLQANGYRSDVTGLPTLAPNGLYTLRDFITTGDVVRIRLPHSQAADGTYNYLWLENHQGKSVWDKAAWSHDGQNPAQPFPTAPRGLIAYVEDLHVTQARPNVPGNTSIVVGAGGMRMLPSGGLLDAKHDGNVSTFNNHWWGNLVYNFVNRRANPTGSFSEQNSPIDDRDGDRIIDHSEYWNGRDGTAHDRNEGFGFVSWDGGVSNGFMGTFMAFNPVNYKLGLDGPTTVFPNQLFDMNTQQLSPIYLSGVSVEIVSQAANGDLTIRVRLNDVDIKQDTRWTGNLALSPELYSAYSAVVAPNVTLTIDRSGTPNRMTPLGNTGTPADFVNPSFLTVRDGAQLLVKDGTVLLRDQSTLYVEDNGSLQVTPDAHIEVGAGSMVCVKTQAEADALQTNNQLTLLTGGLLKIRDTGVVVSGRMAPAPKVMVYPNPTSALHFTVADVPAQGAYCYRVLNSFGQAVRRAPASGAALQAGLTLTGLPAGTYLLEVQQADGTNRVVRRVEVR
jgi:hypothetical protein